MKSQYSPLPLVVAKLLFMDVILNTNGQDDNFTCSRPLLLCHIQGHFQEAVM